MLRTTKEEITMSDLKFRFEGEQAAALEAELRMLIFEEFGLAPLRETIY